MKVLKKNGEEIEFEDITLISKIATNNDILVYNCNICGQEIYKTKKSFKGKFDKDNFVCKKCKTERTLLNKYGVKNISKINGIREKTKLTNLKKYGVECTFANNGVKEKIKQTNLKKYGVEVASKSSKIKLKAEATNLNRYGYKSTFYNKEKIKNAVLEKYGVDIASKNEVIKNKIKEKLLKTFNLEKHRFNLKKAFFNKLIQRNNNLLKPLFSIDEYTGVEKKYTWNCVKCNNIFEDKMDNGRIPRCEVCFPNGNVSMGEKEVLDFVNSLNLEAIDNYRNKFEIDIFIPDKNFGIEFDGLYWHSEKFLDKKYHLDKTNYFKNLGIDVIHVFEDEWCYKKEIVKSIIKSRLNIYDTIIYARKCEIRNVNSQEEREFLENNHIQGYVPSLLCLGLFYNNKLVSLMSFSKSRFNKNYKYELLRFVNKINTKVTGGASKLFKYFKKLNGEISIISYCDLRYFKGNLYEQLCFKLSHFSQPNYFYMKGKDRFSRMQFQKHKLVNLLENFNNELTEKENMKNNGYERIYDCGTSVWVIE